MAAAVIISNLLDTDIKKANPTDPDKTLLCSSGSFNQSIILGDSSTDNALSKGQVMTDSGVYDNNSGVKFQLGNEYSLETQNGAITKASGATAQTMGISLDNAAGDTIYYTQNNQPDSLVLPESTVYYHNGAKIAYADISGILQKDSSIVFSYNSTKTGYAYAVIFDPVYSKPFLAKDVSVNTKSFGTITLYDGEHIVRDGTDIDVTQIEDYDVIYQVSDIWQINKYILDVDNKIGGTITAITPSKLSPKTIQISGTNYDISGDIDLRQLSATPGTFDVNDNIVLSLGYDGKIVDVRSPGTEDNSHYAIVLGSNSKINVDSAGNKTFAYTANLLLADGVNATYSVTSDATQDVGYIVTYGYADDGVTLSLNQVDYNFPQGLVADKADRMLGDSYVADNVKIFNIISDGNGGVSKGEMLSWDDVPSGSIPDNKIWYVQQTGAFNDINVIVTNDLLDEAYKYATVKSYSTAQTAKGAMTSYSLYIDGNTYSYSNYIEGIETGTVLKVAFSGTSVLSIADVRNNPDVTASSIQAYDSRRIKVNDNVYWFGNDLTIYYKDANGNVTPVTMSDFDNQSVYPYSRVYLYLDKPGSADGKVKVVVLAV